MATSGRGTGQSPANVTRFLKGIDFPAEKDDLVQQAKKNHADKEALSLIQNMDEREYDSMADVMKAYGSESHGSVKEGRGASEGQSQSRSSHGKSSHHR